MNRQLVLAFALFAIMVGGVAWIAFVLVKAMPWLLRIYSVADVMKRRAVLLTRADAGRLSLQDLDAVETLTAEIKKQVRGERAKLLVERELEAVALAKVAAGRDEWDKARKHLADVRRAWL